MSDMGKTAPMIPRWAQTIGALLDAGGLAQAWCATCGGAVDIDLVALIEKVGRDYSLVDRRCRCRITNGCIGWNKFRYSASPGSIRWNLRTEACEIWRSEREWAARRHVVDGLRDHTHFLAEKKRRERR